MLWDLLDRINIIIGIIVSLPVISSWWMIYTQKKRQKILIQSLEAAKGNRPVAILIDFGPGESENQVRLFLQENGINSELIKYSSPELKKEDLDNFVRELHRLKARAMEKGADRIHLFYRGPVVGALITGEVFSNASVTIYHFDKASGTYESWGPMHRSFL
ncbi:MAG: SAVED domain-containing protein [Thermodesulfovibrionales bacterium]|nr:SAVED domain-containing protein [Thermodesulfovibrionales bacterium]